MDPSCSIDELGPCSPCRPRSPGRRYPVAAFLEVVGKGLCRLCGAARWPGASVALRVRPVPRGSSRSRVPGARRQGSRPCRHELCTSAAGARPLPLDTSDPRHQEHSVKVFLSTDMEGTAGIVDWEQCVGDGPEAAAGRRLLLNEVNAAIDGALAGGATEIVVNDSHSVMRNLPPAELHGHATYITGRHKPLYMMQGRGGPFAG